MISGWSGQLLANMLFYIVFCWALIADSSNPERAVSGWKLDSIEDAHHKDIFDRVFAEMSRRVASKFLIPFDDAEIWWWILVRCTMMQGRVHIRPIFPEGSTYAHPGYKNIPHTQPALLCGVHCVHWRSERTQRLHRTKWNFLRAGMTRFELPK